MEVEFISNFLKKKRMFLDLDPQVLDNKTGEFWRTFFWYIGVSG